MPEWIRIIYFLPVTTRNDRTAYLRTLDYLRTRHPQISGFTYSQDDPPLLHGYYWSETQQGWMIDTVAVVLIDRPISQGGSEALREEARALKSQIAQFYQEEGSAQEAVCSASTALAIPSRVCAVNTTRCTSWSSDTRPL